MKLVLLSIIATCFLGGNDAITIEESLNQFSVEFFQVAAKDNHATNSITSPISVYSVISMVAAGAAGKTKEQLKSLIHLPEDNENTIAPVINGLNELTTVELRIANRVFAANDLPIEPAFQKQLTTKFGAPISKLNFKDSITASNVINQWSAESTNGLISDIVTPSTISPATKLLLTNAVYFKGNWNRPFDPVNTTVKPFHVNSAVTKQVPTMYMNDIMNFGYLSELKSTFVLLEYQNDPEEENTYMAVILPDTPEDLEVLENNIHTLLLEDLFDIETITVELSLPKFKIESTMDVKKYLSKLGATEIFSENADFSGIVKNHPVQISNIIQKAFIEVNEEGTEGGGFSVLGMEDKSGGSRPSHVIQNVNRPFYVVIATQDVILFTAKVVDPSLQS